MIFNVMESPDTFTNIWLREQVGMSQSLIGLYTAAAMVASMGSLAFLEFWLKARSSRRLMLISGLLLLPLIPAWLFAPGIAARIGLGLVIDFLVGFYWPIAQGQTLAAVPGRAGTMTAVLSLFGLIPMELLFALLAEAIGLTVAMFWVYMLALVALLIVVARR
jgi:hypothetical protein